MSKRKEKFFKLKDKLERIFFKKSITIVPKKLKINLIQPSYPEIDNLNINKVFDKSPSIIKTRKNKFKLSNNIIKKNKIDFKPLSYYEYSSNSKPNLPQNNVQNNLESSKNNINYKKLLKSNKLENTKTVNLEENNLSGNYKNYIISNKNNKISTNIVSLKPIDFKSKVNSVNLNKNNSLETQYKDFIISDKKSNTVYRQTNKQKNLDKTNHIELKYIEKPKDLKFVDENNIGNLSEEIDLNDIVAPTKEQLINIKKYILSNKLPEIQSRNSLKSQTNIRTDKNIKLKTNTKINSTKRSNKASSELDRSYNVVKTNKSPIGNVENDENLLESKPIFIKRKPVFVLPAFMGGTTTPLEESIIGKIHAGETVVPAKQSNIVEGKFNKNDKYKDIKAPEPQTKSYDEHSKTSEKNNEQEKKSEQEKAKEVEQKNKQNQKEDINKLRNMFNFINLPQHDITQNRRQPLYYRKVEKSRMPPKWRASHG